MESIIPAAADTRRHPRADAAVSVRAISKYYGSLPAVDGVSLEVHRGELFGLIGHNGAGKSTLFRMMLGLAAPTSGEIFFGDAAVSASNFRATRRSIGYLPENVVLYENLTGLETLQFLARLKGAPLQECRPALERVGLAAAAGRRVREYSKGMRQRLGFAQALLGRPRILFLDEPTNGLDPEAIREFYAILRSLRAEGVTVILTSHILAEIQERVDRIAIMAAGKIQATGSVQELREQIDLPLWFHVRISPQDLELVRSALGHLPVSAIEARVDHVAVQCHRDAKMAVIEALTALGDRVIDLHVHEPSLEDVFFGFSD